MAAMQKYFEIDEIKELVDQGKKVFWSNMTKTVTKEGQKYIIKCGTKTMELDECIAQECFILPFTVKSKDEYENYLNELEVSEENEYILGGELRKELCHKRLWGEACRKFNPVAFEVGYQEWLHQ